LSEFSDNDVQLWLRDWSYYLFPFNSCSEWDLATFAVPAGVTRIGAYAFRDCPGLKKVEIPVGVTHIGFGAFYGCYRLRDVVIPAGVTRIPIRAFYGCSCLRRVEIPARVTQIDNCASRDCGLMKVEIPVSVMEIGDRAFSGCSRLTELTIPSDIAMIGRDMNIRCGSAFDGVKWLARLELVGSTLDPEVVANLRHCLSFNVVVVGRDLAGGLFGNRLIVAC
jgi:hypothetical protein